MFQGGTACTNLLILQIEMPEYSSEIIDTGSQGGVSWETTRKCYDASCTHYELFNYTWNTSTGNYYSCGVCGP